MTTPRRPGISHVLRGLLIIAALALTACQGTGQTVSQTAAPTSAPPTEAPTSVPPTEAASQATEAPTEAAAAPTGNGPQPLRKDIQIKKLLDTGGGYVKLVRDPVSHDLFYINSQGQLMRLALTAGAQPQQVATIEQIGEITNAAGLACGPDGSIYVVGDKTVDKNFVAYIRKAAPATSGSLTWKTLAVTVPYPASGTQFDHRFNGIAISPDGKYAYVNSGSRSDHGEVEDNKGGFPNLREVPLTSAILRVPTDGQDITLPNDESQLKAKGYFFADGTRNSYDLEFAPNGDLFGGDNGPDEDFPDELNWIQEGKHYGFPWRFGNDDNPQQFPDYDPTKDKRLESGFFAVDSGLYHNDPTFPKPPMAFTNPVESMGPDGDQIRGADGSVQDASDSKQPTYTFTPHRSPLGLVWDQAGVLTDDLKGDAFILSWGFGAENLKLTDGGQDLLALKLTKKGDNYSAQVTQLIRNFKNPIDAVLVDHKLYVLDYGGSGTLWEVTLP